jgi:hypothetical protein
MPKEAAPKPELINPLIQERLADPERDGVTPALDRLAALRERAVGWNGYDALAPDRAAIAFAEAWLGWWASTNR